MRLPEGVEPLSFGTPELTVDALAAGPADGELVLLLHGFPELAYSWRHQLSALAAAGYRAVAPNQRGYAGTTRAKPYDVDRIALDAAEMIEALGREKAIVVGHDWGGGVAWTLAQEHPERVSALIVANCPPPAVMAKALLTNPRQLARSWYMFFFQLPALPEHVISKDRASNVARALVGGSHNREAFTAADLEVYRNEFSKPGAAGAAINWYRAAVQKPWRARSLAKHKITAPTLIIWGVHDRALGEELVTPESLSLVMAPGNQPEIHKVPEAGHFVQNEAPGKFNQLMLKWLASHQARNGDL